MPRPLRTGEDIRGGNVNLCPSSWDALRELAFRERTTVSEQLRRAVDEYLARKRKGGQRGEGRK
jgi:hypothetical protein